MPEQVKVDVLEKALAEACSAFDGTTLPSWREYTKDTLLPLIARHYAAREREEWIPVSERLPEYDVDVFLWSDKWERIYLGYWRHSDEWIGRSRPESNDALPDTNPTHWRPLPAAPFTAQGDGQ